MDTKKNKKKQRTHFIVKKNEPILNIKKSAKTKSKSSNIFPSLKSLSPDYDPSNYEGFVFDVMLHAIWSRFIGWLSPASFTLSFSDWFLHLSISPAKQMALMKKAYENLLELSYSLECLISGKKNICKEQQGTDPRFQSSEWEQFPFNLWAQSFLLGQQWWDEATKSIRGVSHHHQQVIHFLTRQVLDMLSPSNFVMTNPEVLRVTIESLGLNFFRGFLNFKEDYYRIVNKLPPVGSEKFQVGKNLAITPGKVIFRNKLIELIQYSPATETVYKEPLLIIPAWIMKYYILDLSPYNSLVKYLVDQGHTVFMISWKNPTSSDRDLSMQDYLNLGIFEAMNVINTIIPHTLIHAVGYCIGGTLLMIAAATLASRSDTRLKSITLFAAQIDFKDAGELLLFIDQSEITYLEDIMWERGYLDGQQMAHAFSMLHSNDLIWSQMIHNYLLGKRKPMIDLIAWDNDTTRLPLLMQSEYLHQLFLNNDLAQGRYKVDKHKIALPDITDQPMFVISTVKDHVSPWKSVYKIHLFCDTEITFVLTSGGHNAGIVSEPGHLNRNFQMMTHKPEDKHLSAETWQELAPQFEGSWWPAWHQWLVLQSTSKKVLPPKMGNPKAGYPILDDAPGSYVLQK